MVALTIVIRLRWTPAFVAMPRSSAVSRNHFAELEY